MKFYPPKTFSAKHLEIKTHRDFEFGQNVGGIVSRGNKLFLDNFVSIFLLWISEIFTLEVWAIHLTSPPGSIF